MSPPNLPDVDALRWERRARELLQRLAVDVSRAGNLHEALLAMLRAVCAYTGWPVGHVYERADGADTLVSARIWHLDEPDTYGAFRRISEAFTFASGVGMPGRVLATGRPVWIMDVTVDTNFPRARLAEDLGIRAAFGFPVVSRGSVVAVLEFFSPRTVPPDEPLLEVMGSLGFQLGHLHERLRADARLVASERRFRSVAASATDAVVTVDVHGHVVSWNAAAERMFGWTEAESVGVSLDRIIPAGYRAAHHAGMARVAGGGAPRVVGKTVELHGTRRDGTEFPLELSLGTWAGEDGRYFTGILRDISLRKEAERQLQAQAERLDRQNAALARANADLQRSKEEILESWRQMEQIFSAFADALPGQELDARYRLDAKVGSGGYGVVYRAWDLVADHPVAVKVFRPANGRLSPDHVARFRREGLTATRVSHPNAVRVLDSGVSSAGIPYLVMELLVGRTLTQRLRTEGPLSAREAVALVRALGEALAVAHAEGIVHRDIKPDNVFLEGVTSCVTTGHVKLLDFGIARLLDDTDADALDAITRTGQLVGTPVYMAPERLQGLPYDGRSDVYSVGVLLFEALSGTRPFDSPGRTPWEIIRHHLSSPVPALADVVEGLPEELVRISAWALAREPADRPTARQLVDALAAVPLPGEDGRITVRAAPAPIVASVTLDTED